MATPTDLPVLETERLILRAFELADAPAVQAMACAREIADTTLSVPHPYPEDGAASWIASHPAQRERGEYAFAIILKEGNLLVGSIGLSANRGQWKAELGYWIGVLHWNQGYATEAARRILAWGFEGLMLNRIFARHLARNPASGRVMQKAGLQYEGTFKQDVLKWDVYEDVIQYGLVRAEYKAATG